MIESHRIWSGWQPGPEDGPDGTVGAVIVSLTDYTAHSFWSIPGIVRRGRRLGLGWYGLPGAVGLYLWADPLHHRVGSLSVWTDRTALRRWVGLPLHVRTMRRYRDRGSIRAATWPAEEFRRGSTLAEANRRLDLGDWS